MVTFTHSMLAGKVYNHFVKRGYRLSKFCLKFGSIKQDFIKDKINHFKDESIYLFYQKYKQLKKINPSQQNNLFSLKLGEIYHYLCDYFCYAHNKHELCKQPITHTIYEFRLHHFAQKLDENFYININLDKRVNEMSFPKLLEYYHKKYLKNPPSFTNDIYTAYKVCILVTLKLMIDTGYYNQNIDRQYKEVKTI